MEPVAKTSLFLAYVFQFTSKTFIFYYFLSRYKQETKEFLCKIYFQLILKLIISKKLLIKKELIFHQ
ncbi:hypothetical protein COD67_22515 [Bacillus cereus]|nr:hypothetical protein COI89_23965 [Bacillus cereus]PGU62696.1 hypothetical protein COD67_22515 [Bacillus cereus]